MQIRFSIRSMLKLCLGFSDIGFSSESSVCLAIFHKFLTRLNWIERERGKKPCTRVFMPLYHYKFLFYVKVKPFSILSMLHFEMCAHNSTKLIHRQVNTHFFFMTFSLAFAICHCIRPQPALGTSSSWMLPKVFVVQTTKSVWICRIRLENYSIALKLFLCLLRFFFV